MAVIRLRSTEDPGSGTWRKSGDGAARAILRSDGKRTALRNRPRQHRARKPGIPSGVSRNERQEGSEIVVTRSGCRRGTNLRRVHASRVRPREPTRCFGTEHVHADRNVTNPMSGTELQYARILAPEQAVEVVRDHEDGAWAAVWQPTSRTAQRLRLPLLDRRAGVRETEEGRAHPGGTARYGGSQPLFLRTMLGGPVDTSLEVEQVTATARRSGGEG
jgi:hypothetical protein